MENKNPWCVVDNHGNVRSQSPSRERAEDCMSDNQLYEKDMQFHITNEIPWNQWEEIPTAANPCG